MKKAIRWVCAIGAGGILTLSSIALGYSLYTGMSGELPKVHTNNIYANQPTTVTESTIVRYVYHYEEDDRELIYEEPAPGYLLGLDTEGVRAAMEGYEVCQLTDTGLVLRKTIEGRSNAHYFIGEKDGYVAIYFDSGILKEKTATPLASLPAELQAGVLRGITIEGNKELMEYLEALES